MILSYHAGRTRVLLKSSKCSQPRSLPGSPSCLFTFSIFCLWRPQEASSQDELCSAHCAIAILYYCSFGLPTPVFQHSPFDQFYFTLLLLYFGSEMSPTGFSQFKGLVPGWWCCGTVCGTFLGWHLIGKSKLLWKEL